ncbi:protein-tyrosine phosphatase-like protein [Trichophaea hybrida]|nr:protein-tyrosine phosphatase-like protein [Trichophaea hybrida]
MSMPATTFPKKAYRNPHDRVLAFLERKHGDRWSVWEFRAEGTGYKDIDFHNRIFHAPFPDHHPPPFALIPYVVASMRNHLKGGENRVAVVHCKAGKGRSGTMSCAYLISEEGYSAADAMAQFTRARMRPGFGDGVSIPSQRRYINYIESWARTLNKQYMEWRVRIHSLHIWGLSAGVRVAVQGYVDEGKVIKTFHTFSKKERKEMDKHPNASSANVILEPATLLILPTNDVNIDFERRSSSKYGFAVVTSIAHVWFNAFFEAVKGEDSGVFEIDWKAMDGIKGTSRKGMQALDKLQVVWSVDHEGEKVIEEPAQGEPVPMMRKAVTHRIGERDWGLTHLNNDSGSSIVGENSESEGGAMATGIIKSESLEVNGGKEPCTVKEPRIGAIKKGGCSSTGEGH